MARDLIKIKKLTDDIRAAVERGKTPEFTDKRTIAKYESMPNHNVIERAFDKDKRKEYNAKQQLLDSYTKAKERETQRFIEKNNISDSTIKNAFGNFSKEDAEYLKNIPGSNMDYLREYHDKLQDNERAEKVKDFTEEHPVLSNIASPFVNLAGGFGYGGAALSNYLSGKPLTHDGPEADILELGRDIKSTSKGLIDENVSDKLKGVANLAYDTGGGVGEFLAAKSVPLFGPLLMAASAFGNAAYDAVEKDVNPSQAMGTALVSGGSEYLLNKLPFGTFDDALKSGNKSVVKNIARQGAAEAIEEGTTEGINTIADALINKDKSDFALAKQQYMINGMSEEEATKQALVDSAKNVGYSALVGGLSGSTIGGGTTLYNNVVGRNNVDNVGELDPLGTLNATVEGEQQTIDNQPTQNEPLNVAQATTQEPTNLIQPLETDNPINVTPTQENVANQPLKQYNTKTIEGFDDVSKQMNKLIGMYGNDSIRTMHSQVMSLVNEYIATNDSSKFAEAMEIASEIDRQLLGKTYKYKATRKGIKGENARTSVTYTPDSYIETLYSEASDYKAAAKANVDTIANAGYNNNVNVNGSSLNGGNINGENINGRTGIDGISDKRTESGHQYSGEMEKAGENSGRNTGIPQELVVISESNKAKLNAKGITSNEFRSTTNNPELFSFALATARSANKNGVMVSPRSASELAEGNVKTFLSADGLVGGAVEKNGNITGVFKNPKSNSKGAVTDIILTALQNGGTKLDCYGEFLLDSYSRLGFEPVARVKFSREAADPDWNYDLLGEPDIYFMKHNGKSIDEVIDDYINGNAVVYSQEYIDSLPYMEYEEAEAYRDSLIPKSDVVQSTMQGQIANTNKAYTSTSDIEGNNQRVRSYNNTLIEKTDAPQTLKNEFIDNPDVYTQLSNQKTLDTAMEILNNNDIDTAINEYRKLLEARNPVAVPLGYNISKHLAKNGKLDESVQIVREMSEALTKSGQFSQAAAITMLNNNPEAAKRYLVRQIDFLNREGKEKFGKKWNKFELTKEELQRFNDIADGDAEAIKNLYNDVFTRVRKEYPSTLTEKLMEYRRVAMLLNVRTNVRNVVSNAFMLPVRWTADRVAALGEGVYSLIKPEYSRTQSLTTSKESKQLASKAFENVKSELLSDNKYEDRKDAVRDKQVFKGTALSKSIDNVFNGAITKANQAMGKDVDPSLMETARNFTYYLLQKGDDVFVKKNFESRMASYLEAQGITSLEDIPADAYMLATQEALKATFKDDTALANGLSHFRQMLNKAPGGMLGDIVMPFTKTPANLAMRGIDYSPIGVYNGIKTLKNAKDNADVSKGITQLAQSATGTMAIALGMALAEAGLISGALSEDKDEAQFQRQQGQLPYAIKTPYGYFSYDWAQPASIPLILGVTIHDSFVNGKDFVNGMKQGSLAAVDSWLELSPLQNMSEIFGGYGTPAENVAEVLFNDFPLSFVPSQLNAIAKVGDRTQRVSYSPDSKASFLNQTMAKVPFLSNDLPVAYDTWGNPIERQDNVGEAIFANMLNPGQFGNENATQIDDDIMALYDATGNASVFPKKAAWSYKVGGENIKLDNKQYSEFQRIAGNNAYSMADSLINSDYYTSLSDEQKVKIISGMYSFADALAKTEILGYDVEDSDTYKKSYAVYKEKGVDGVALFTSIKTVADGETSNAAHINAVNQFDVSDEEKGYYITKLKGKLSQEAQEVFQTDGYAGVYKHYYTKALAEKVKEARKYSEMGITSDMVEKVKQMRNDSPKTYVTQEMIEAVRKMRSGK